jgi:hypothetical protein
VGSPYVITPSAATGTYVPTNYNVVYVPGALAVTPAPLSVTANDASKVYGQVVTLPVTAFTSTGLLNGDSITSVTETSPGTVATAPVVGSPYVITPSAATGTYVPTNYNVVYVPGNLTVVPAVVVVPPVFNIPVVDLPPDRVPPIVVTPPVFVPPLLIPPTIITPVETPPVLVLPVVAPPVVATIDTPPSSYVAPLRKRKQDRN